MRICTAEIEITVAESKRIFGNNTRVVLFGSRVDDNKRGGDIDILIRPDSYFNPDSLIEKKLL